MNKILLYIVRYMFIFFSISLSSIAMGEIIDGPANVRVTPKGNVLVSLDDGVEVECVDFQDNWYKINFIIRLKKEYLLSELIIKKNTMLFNDKGYKIGKTVNNIKLPYNYYEINEYYYTKLIAYTYKDNIKNGSKEFLDEKEKDTENYLNKGNPFSGFKEINVSESPDTKKSIDFKKEIIDFCILPDNSNVAFITEEAKHSLYLWNYHTLEKSIIYYPEEFIPIEIISHPQDIKIFILGKEINPNNNTAEYKILKYDIAHKRLSKKPRPKDGALI